MSAYNIEDVTHAESAPSAVQWPLVADHHFILATRDTGYRSLPAAVAELIDNALQAGARQVHVLVREDRESGRPPLGTQADLAPTGTGRALQARRRRIEIAVLDDGAGMDADTLRTALQFGGSARFDDRTGAGRFGMGLPNSSVSQSRRVEVYTWQGGHESIFSYLDVDQIAAGLMHAVPAPIRRAPPEWVRTALVQGALVRTREPAAAFAVGPGEPIFPRSGTLVVWPACDRLPFRKASTTRTKLKAAIARLYRYALRDGVQIRIDGETVTPADPLMEWGPATEVYAAAAPLGDDLRYELKVPGDPTRTSIVRVRFSVLPIHAWAHLPVDVRRQLGVIGGAGVSVVRANREIDYGWYFMGGKRKENYDDWWRCEVCFEPPLDEYFGVTHSKQGVTPHPRLLDVMAPDMELIARKLNARVRGEFVKLAQRRHRRDVAYSGSAKSRAGLHNAASLFAVDDSRASTATAARCERLLPPIGRRLRTYRVTYDALDSGRFYEVRLESEVAVLSLNANHPLVAPYLHASTSAPDALFQLECCLLAAARAELALGRESFDVLAREPLLERYVDAWSDALAAFLSARR